MAWAQDDAVALEAIVKFYEALKAAGVKPEAHIFSAGGHGFGMRKQGTTSDHWVESFYYWLEAQGLARPGSKVSRYVPTAMRLLMKSMMSCVEVPGRKISAMPDFFMAGMSASGMMPPTSTVTSSMPLALSRAMSCGQMVLCAPDKNGQADDVHVFLNGCGSNHFRSLSQAGVDDLHAGVAQGARNNFGAAIVTVEAGLGD